MKSKTGKISLTEKIGYGLGDTATNFVFQAMNMFIVFFYTDVFGIPAATMGIMFFITRMWDAVSDPMMGAIADRTNTRWGKFRPWILWTSIPFAVISVAMFTTPNLSVNGKIVYAFVTYFLMMTIFTANNIPYSALSGVITSNVNERTSISSFRFMLAMLAAFAVQGFTLDLVKHIGANDESVIHAQIEGDQLLLHESGTGTSQIELTAVDPQGNHKSFTFLAKIYPEAQRPPTLVKQPEPLLLNEGFQAYTFSFRDFFESSDDLKWSAKSAHKKVVGVSITDDTCTLLENGVGIATLTLTATNRTGASRTINWEVRVNQTGNQPPVFIKDTLPMALASGFERKEFDLKEWVTDPDGDELSYLASVSDRGIASVEAAASILKVREKSTGETTLNLSVSDGKGGKSKLSVPFSISSPQGNVPHIQSPLNTIELNQGFAVETVNIGDLFADLDSQELRIQLTTYNNAKGYQISMAIYSCIAAILFLITFLTTRERVAPPKSQKSSILKDAKVVLTNKPWLVLFFVGLFNFIFITFRSSASIYYFKYYVGNDDLFGLFNIVGLVALVAGITLAKPLSQRFGKKWIYLISKFMIGVSTLGFLFVDPEGIAAIFALQIMGSFFSGKTIPLLWSMVGDVADYGEWKSGTRATGMTFSGVTFSFKFGQGVGGALTGILLSAFGYVANAEQSAESLMGIKLMMSLFPAIASFLVAGLLLFYKLDNETMAGISKDLEARRAAEA